MSGRIEVGPADAFEEGDRQLVQVGDTQVGVLRIDGAFHALENECPHQGGPVCTGRIGGKIIAEQEEVGARAIERVSDQPVIACPWHGWEYEVETGEHIGNPRVALETYGVTVEDGTVYVEP